LFLIQWHTGKYIACLPIASPAAFTYSLRSTTFKLHQAIANLRDN
jgi:hypothetical protein